MFATLIICLPSQHTGGAVRLQHGEKSARFDTSESSAFDTTFIAWFVLNACFLSFKAHKDDRYTDVTHEASRPFDVIFGVSNSFILDRSSQSKQDTDGSSRTI